MKKFSELKTSNIPIANLLGRFISRYNDFHKQEIINYFDSNKNKILTDKRFYFFQFPNEFLSFILRDLILYFESYLHYNFWCTAYLKKKNEILRLLKNPSTVDREIAKAVFHSIPAKFDADFSLKTYNVDAYGFMLDFYKKVRNPLFHGNQLNSGTNINDFVEILEIYKELYLWVSSWTLGDLLLKEEGEILTFFERKSK